jgi:hypothetical protein
MEKHADFIDNPSLKRYCLEGFRRPVPVTSGRNTAPLSGVKLCLVLAGSLRTRENPDTNIVFLLPFFSDFPVGTDPYASTWVKTGLKNMFFLEDLEPSIFISPLLS